MIDTETRTQRVHIKRLSLRHDVFDLSRDELILFDQFEPIALKKMRQLYYKHSGCSYDPIDDFYQLARLSLCDAIKGFNPDGVATFEVFLKKVIEINYFSIIKKEYLLKTKFTGFRKNIKSIYEPSHSVQKSDSDEELIIDTLISDTANIDDIVCEKIDKQNYTIIDVIMKAFKDIISGKVEYMIYNGKKARFRQRHKQICELMIRGYTVSEINDVINKQMGCTTIQNNKEFRRIKNYILMQLHEHGYCLDISEYDKCLGKYDGRKMTEFLREYL